MKFIPRDLNPDPCLSHPISTYNCEVTTTSRMYDGNRT